MTVLLVGVGAHTDHVQPALQLDDRGRFEYLPIPETESTVETATYGSWPLEHQDGTAIDIVDSICPTGDGGWITEALRPAIRGAEVAAEAGSARIESRATHDD